MSTFMKKNITQNIFKDIKNFVLILICKVNPKLSHSERNYSNL